jgi:preprotein translocase subunit SecB
MDGGEGNGRMGDGSVDSAFKFVAYKIHHVNLRMPQVEIGRQPKEGDVWQVKMGIAVPQYHVKQKAYVSAIDCGLYLFEKDPEKEGLSPEQAIVVLEMGIAGVFEVQPGRLEKDIEDRLVRAQLPALLFPYIRGAMTSLLANAGFGSVIIPLVNMNEAGRDALKDKEILIIDD